MMTDMEQARRRLEQGGYTCVLCRGEEIITSRERGVAPLLRLLEEGRAFGGFSAADKVVGKAAAMLYVRLGVSAVWAGVISEPALGVLRSHSVVTAYGRCVSAIRNRSNTGNCPMETAVWDLEDPAEGEKAIRATLERMTGRSGHGKD